MIWCQRMDSAQKSQIHEYRKRLGNPYALVTGEGEFGALPQPLIDPISILARESRDRPRSKRNIETIVRKLHEALWLYRQVLLPDRESIVPLDLLNPSLVFRSIGYQSELVDSLGVYSSEGELFEVAGIIQGCDRRVQISRQFKKPIRKFTEAHELGHAILHRPREMHRERPVDGAEFRGRRDRKEAEADVFAAYFLMPEKQVRPKFEERFLTQRFELNDQTAFALNAESQEAIWTQGSSKRYRSMMLARAQQFNGHHFLSLADIFGVSTEAMAIRLEELALICD